MPEQGVQDWLRWRSTVSPERLALKFGSVEWTFEELQERASNLSALLLLWGIKRGDRVALLLRPSEAYIALVHAITRVGAVAVPMNHRQTRAELLLQLRDSDPSLVVHDDSLGERLKDRTGRRKGSRLWKRASQLSFSSPPRGKEPVVGDTLDMSSLHSIVYTSGSSGSPKGVELTVSNIHWNAVSFGLRNGACVSDRWLLAMPLFHVGGYTVIFRSVLHGSGIVLHQGFDAERVSESLDREEITLTSFVPTMLAEVLDSRGVAPFPPRLRIIFLGGAQTPYSLVTRIKERRLPVVLTYGMTETCSQIALSPVEGRPSGRNGHKVNAYRTMFPSEVAIMRLGRKGAPTTRPEEVGEIVVRGPTISRGYWRDRKATADSFDGHWFRTGDLGFRTRSAGEHEFVVLGREDEMIISGGEHIYPVEVETSLTEHEAVNDAVVLGREDERWGQRVEAVLEMKDEFRDNHPSGQELAAFLKERVASYKIPKAYHFWAKLPRTPTGKPKREAVRRLLESK